MKKRILSLTAAVAAVITTTGIVATNNESIAKLASKSEIIEKAGQELLILPPVLLYLEELSLFLLCLLKVFAKTHLA